MAAESKLEAKVRWIARSRGWWDVKIEKTSRDGFPDRLMARNGVIILLEVKRDGEPPRRSQVQVHKELRSAGVRVYTVDNEKDAYDLLY